MAYRVSTRGLLLSIRASGKNVPGFKLEPYAILPRETPLLLVTNMTTTVRQVTACPMMKITQRTDAESPETVPQRLPDNPSKETHLDFSTRRVA